MPLSNISQPVPDESPRGSVLQGVRQPQRAAMRTVGAPRTLSEGGYLHHRHAGTMLPPFIAPEAVDALQNTWDTDEHDLFVCTHQKVGTHLTKKFVVEVLRALGDYPEDNPLASGDIGHHSVPWPEVMVSQEGYARFEQFCRATKGRERLWYVHSSVEDLPVRRVHKGSKFVVVLRDPRGAAVSQYFFYKRHPLLQVPEDLDLSTFIERFVSGDLFCGDNQKHVQGWLRRGVARIAPDQVLVLRYEDLVERKVESVEALVSFLRPGVRLSPERCAKIAASTEFQTMKRSITRRPGSFHFDPSTFFRAGTTRDWEQHLDSKQVARIDAKTRRVWGDDPTCPDLSGLRTLDS